MLELINDVNRIVLYLCENKEDTIENMSREIGLNENYIFNLVKNINQYTYNDLQIVHSINDSFCEVNYYTLKKIAKWKVKGRADKIILKVENQDKFNHKLVNSISQNQSDSVELANSEKSNMIIRAMHNRKKIHIIYKNQKKELIDVIVAPITFIINSENYLQYLLVLCDDNEYYPYRIDRILKVEETKSDFSYPDDEKIVEYLDSGFNLEIRNEEYFKVIFYDINNCHEKAKKKLGKFGVFNKEENNLVFEGILPSKYYINQWLRGFGDWVEIIEPEWAIEDIKKHARLFIERNGGEE